MLKTDYVNAAMLAKNEACATLIDALGDAKWALLAQHGALVVGRDLRQAHLRAATLEWRCRRAYEARLAGGAEPGPYSPKKPSDVRFPNFPESVYPAVMTHPISGMKVLGIVEQFLDRVVTPHKVGLSNDESIDLLKRLVAHTRDPQFHYFHQWQVGDMVLWDNWRAMHCTTGTPPGVRRRINRTTIEGKHTLGRILLDE